MGKFVLRFFESLIFEPQMNYLNSHMSSQTIHNEISCKLYYMPQYVVFLFEKEKNVLVALVPLISFVLFFNLKFSYNS